MGQDRANCPFFLKTGACRFGDRCSRKHVHPPASPTLMIRGMFATFGMDQRSRDDYDTDACLEHSEEEVQQQFVDFYEDVLPEFRTAGKVVQFKVSCNFEPHLRGNVYVQFDTEEQCREAFMMFNGRWYAGKQLQCEFSPVTRWKTAICGLFDRQKCPKGKHCNFLHVYRNPGNEFWEADRDLHMSPDRGGGGTGSFAGGRFSERSNRSSWTERSQSRRGERSRRSRSRESRIAQRRASQDMVPYSLYSALLHRALAKSSQIQYKLTYTENIKCPNRTPFWSLVKEEQSVRQTGNCNRFRLL
uniref:Zinc finger CCCH-type, RNA binding motif and serine/arginine rich 2 n=1 Tax=Salmo trutta TaxID=8032 RepID=A0A674AUU1_SALTR